jgi:hypothetical protein
LVAALTANAPLNRAIQRFLVFFKIANKYLIRRNK